MSTINELLPLFTKNNESSNYLDNILSIEAKYDYIELDEGIVKKIKKIYNNYKDRANGLDRFVVYLEKTLKGHVLDNLKDEKRCYDIVASFIAKHINNESKNYAGTLAELDKLVNFFEEFEYVATPELIIKIVKENEKVKDILKKVIDKHQILENGEGLSLLKSSNENLSALIDTYCHVNCIHISNTYDDLLESEFDSNYYSEDSLQMFMHSIPSKILTDEEMVDLFQRFNQGDEAAKEIIFEHNLRLVAKVAFGYRIYGLDPLDLIQEGSIGLLKSIDKYDYTKGYKFSTYALYWIKQKIRRAISDKGHNIKIPSHAQILIDKYVKIRRTLMIKLDREPSVEELAKEMNIPASKLALIIKTNEPILSLNSFIENDTSIIELENMIYKDEDSIDVAFEKKQLTKEILGLFNKCKLGKIEQYVLIKRFGLGGREAVSLESIAQKMSLTRERVRQIEAKSIRNIRRSPYIKDFAIYMDNPTEVLKTIEEDRRHVKGQKYTHVYNRDTKPTANISNLKTKYKKSKITSIEDESITKEDYLAISDMLQTDEFNEMALKSSTSVALALCLNNGWINNRCFSDEEISKVLGITSEEVTNIKEEAKNFYKSVSKSNCKLKVKTIKN